MTSGARLMGYAQGMNASTNIVIGDESALHLYLHHGDIRRLGAQVAVGNPISSCAMTSNRLSAFNTSNPLYGGEPVTILVAGKALRRETSAILSRTCSQYVPEKSFLKLREGLYVISPELTLTRMARHVSIVQLVEMAMNLCGRYYLDLRTQRIEDRTSFLTNVSKLRSYIARLHGANGSAKAERALRWVLDNSGSPYESKMALVFRLPLSWGGFGLRFDAMNYDVRIGRLAYLAEQSEYCIDMVNIDRHVGLEYDGDESHQNTSHDKRRRNALAALGWNVFPIDKAVLHSPEHCEKAAYQLARQLGVRIQKPRNWEANCERLRRDLKLPV